MELTSKAGIFGFFKYRLVNWGEPVEFDVLDLIARKSLLDVTFGKIKVRLKCVWRPSSWYEMQLGNSGQNQ